MNRSLLELRVLEGPNLYFPRAAVKLTLDVEALTGAPVEEVRRVGERLGMGRIRPGPAATAFRQRTVLRLLVALVRRLAGRAGTTRLAVRARPTSDPAHAVVAFPWRHRGRAEAFGAAVAEVLDRLASDPATDVEGLLDDAARQVNAAERGDRPRTLRPKIPVVAITGTNGKTTTARMIAHIARAAGRHVGWSSTDGIYVDGGLVEAGDYSGPSGAGRVLSQPGVDFAVTETARGGILLKGIGVTHNDVSVVTNVSADHLGMHGIDTVDQLAEVKAVVPRITRRNGWAVLNADDPRTLAMRVDVVARPWVFSRDPDAPGVRTVLSEGGRATTVLDGWVSVLERGRIDPLIEVAEIPMTLSGLSRFNVENALAAASAALAAGIARDHVVSGLRTFRPDPEHNPGRMNIFSLGEVSVVVDLAHNEAGLEALLEIMAGVRRPGGRLLLGLGAVGDRQDELIEALGEIGARGADAVAIGHKERYLRGRTAEEIAGRLRAGAARVGVTDIEAHATELASLQALLRMAQPGDVVGLMCHAEREEVYDWLAGEGATPDTPAVLRAKVLARSEDVGPARARQ